MKKFRLISMLALSLTQINADVSGGDLLFHDLQSKVDELQVPSPAAASGCGEPPAGYLVWLDGTDPDANGLNPIGGSKTTWTDKGTQARSFAASTAANEASYNTSGYFTFDGTDDHYSATKDSNWGALFGDSDHFCSHLIDRDATGGTNQVVFGTYLTGSSGTSNYMHTITSVTESWYYTNHGSGAHVNKKDAFTEPTGFYQYDTEYDLTNTRTRIAVDGTYSVYTTTTAPNSTAPTSSYYYYQIGAWSSQISTGTANSALGGVFKGDIAQIICYTDLTKKAALDTWMTCKKDELTGGA